MNHKDPQLNQLYHDGAKTQPPKSIDKAILAQAEQAIMRSKYRKLRPWLAAASILFALPILWLLVQQPEIQQSLQDSWQPEATPTPSIPDTKPQPKAASPTATNTPLSADPQDQESTQGIIPVTGSRVRAQKQASNTTTLEAPFVADDSVAPSTSAHQQESTAEGHNLRSAQPIKPIFEAEVKTQTDAMNAPAEDAALRSSPFEPLSTVVTITDLLQQIKPEEITEQQHKLWQNLQRQLAAQQWQQAQKTLEQLKLNHPDVDFSTLSKHIEKFITKE